MTGKWESAICMVSGTTAGLLMGFGSSMWKESVVINRISLFGVPWLMLVLLCMMRWITRRINARYLYAAMFFFGICATIHQTLTLRPWELKSASRASDAKLGRDVFLPTASVFSGL
jgi:hypothetical protein